jgi:hypothetical protein
MNRTMNWLLSAILLFSSFGAVVAQERVYIKSPLTVEPGTSKTNINFTLSLDGDACEEPFVAYQMDIVLPEGLSMEYTKAGKPRITLVKPGVLPSYTDYNDEGEEVDVYTHSLNVSEVGDAVRVIVYSSDPDENLRYFTKKSGDLLRVYMRPTGYLKPGDVDIKLRDVTFGKNDAMGTKQPSVALTGVTAAATSTVSVKVSAAHQYSTLVLPFDVASIPDGLTVYSCNNTNGENLVLTPQSRIKAYTPYILYAPNGFDATWSGAVDATKYSAVVTDGYLTGAVTTQEVTGGAGHYVLQNKGDGPMFYKVGDSSTFSIQPGKCWLTLPEGVQSATAFRFGTTTAVEQLKVSNENAAIYDLSGRRQNDMNQRGIYIVNGQKVIK